MGILLSCTVTEDYHLVSFMTHNSKSGIARLDWFKVSRFRDWWALSLFVKRKQVIEVWKPAKKLLFFNLQIQLNRFINRNNRI